MEINNPNLTSVANDSDNFNLDLTLKPIVRILLRFLKTIYIIGFTVIGIILMLALILWSNIHFLGTNNNMFHFLSSILNYVRKIDFIILGSLSIAAYLYSKPLKRYHHSGLKTDLVECFYQLITFFSICLVVILLCLIMPFTI